MKVNQQHALTTGKVLLVPYSSHHVPTYHSWMQDAELQAATASEPLTLTEEYAMQRSWREDADKLTFIVCMPLDCARSDIKQPLRTRIDDAPERMIGDINLFLLQPDNDDDDKAEGVVGEIELMIARKDLHRKGYGRAALITFMGYVLLSWPTIWLEYNNARSPVPWPTPPSKEELPAVRTPETRSISATSCDSEESRPGLRYLRVKIQQSNGASIALFESVGFKRMSAGANYFGEVELRWKDDGGFLRRLKDTLWMKGDGWDAGVVPYDEHSLATPNG